MTERILDVVKECDNFTHDEVSSASESLAKTYYAFMVNGCDSVLGYINRDIVQKIQWSSVWNIDHDQQTVILATPVSATAEVRSQAVEDTLKATRKLGGISLLQSWRNETFPVYGPQGEILLEIERCASALFGIVTYGVQLICYVQSEQGTLLWIGKRSEEKQTYPGMLDTTAAGGLPAGKSPIDAVISEAQEEASIPETLIRQRVKSMPPLTYFHVRGDKAGGEKGLLQPEVEYTYELELDSSMIPRPRDSEVESFKLFAVEEAIEALNKQLFKPNSAIVVVEFLIQHGILTPENMLGYPEIISHLHRKLEFPLLIQPSI